MKYLKVSTGFSYNGNTNTRETHIYSSYYESFEDLQKGFIKPGDKIYKLEEITKEIVESQLPATF